MFRVVIPARYGSTRLPGKPLLPLAGKPMIQWVYERARRSRRSPRSSWPPTMSASRSACASFGGEAQMTRLPAHASGTDRIAELARRERWDDGEIVVNVQGDEPLMPAAAARSGGGAAGSASGRRSSRRWRCRWNRSRRCWIRTSSRWWPTNGSAHCISAARRFPGRAMSAPAGTGKPAQPRAARRHLGLYAYRVPSLLRAGGAAAQPARADREARAAARARARRWTSASSARASRPAPTSTRRTTLPPSPRCWTLAGASRSRRDSGRRLAGRRGR